MGIYIGIDAQRNGCRFVFGGSQLVDHFHFGNRLNVKTENILIQCQINFPVGFSNSGKNYFFFRKSGFNGSIYFSSTHTIGPKTGIFNFTKQHGICIGLHGIMYHVVSFLNLSIHFLKRLPQDVHIVIIKRRLQL